MLGSNEHELPTETKCLGCGMTFKVRPADDWVSFCPNCTQPVMFFSRVYDPHDWDVADE